MKTSSEKRNPFVEYEKLTGEPEIIP